MYQMQSEFVVVYLDFWVWDFSTMLWDTLKVTLHTQFHHLLKQYLFNLVLSIFEEDLNLFFLYQISDAKIGTL